MSPRANPSAARLIVGAAVLLLVTGCSPTAPSQNRSTSTSAPPPPEVSVMIMPSWPTVRIGEVQQFTASVIPASASQAVTWSISGTAFISEGCTGAGCGTIDATGRYTAPATTPYPPNVVVTATSMADPTKAGTARVLIFKPPPPSCRPSIYFVFCVNPASVDFGTQTVNTTSEPRTVTLTNISSAAQHVFGGPAGVPGIWSDYSATTDCSVLAAGASCTFSITFKPSATGDRSQSVLHIENDDGAGDEGVDVALKGVGIAGG
jgi:ASPM-SPD-2-Hydin domain-containing protein/Big-like domain-containing protein